MPVLAPPLPSRFPCWCRAVYSWGGETKRDLGFVEGDLIECLNAGDGSWWMGRLKRDRRIIGLFPSNFVEVLEENFHPKSARSSLAVELERRRAAELKNDSSSTGSTPHKKKSVFRKPFQAYHEAEAPKRSTPTASPQRGISKPQVRSSSRSSHNTYASMRGRSPAGASPRDSPAPSNLHSSRAMSPALMETSRPASPIPPSLMIGQSLTNHALELPQHGVPTRSGSPFFAASDITPDTSPTPPPPPPHRVLYAGSRAPSPLPDTHSQSPRAYDSLNSASPARTASRSAHTPSPISHAMNDVMLSLKDMTVSEFEELSTKTTAPDIWSSDAFEDLYTSKTKGTREPMSNRRTPNEDNYRRHNSQDETSEIKVETGSPSRGYLPNLEDGISRSRSRARSQTHGYNFEEPSDDLGSSRPVSQGYNDKNKGSNALHRLMSRRSTHEISKKILARTFTGRSSGTVTSTVTNSTCTNGSNATGITIPSLMSGSSAGGISATSAGSYARRRFLLHSTGERPLSTVNDVQFHDIPEIMALRTPQVRSNTLPTTLDDTEPADTVDILGGLTAPRPKKTGVFRKLMETAKTSAATARMTVGTNHQALRQVPGLKKHTSMPNNVAAVSSQYTRSGPDSTNVMMNNGVADWMQVRRDVNRSNSLSQNERAERTERCQMLDIPVIRPMDILLNDVEGDQSSEGLAITDPTDFNLTNLALVDKTARYLSHLPPTISLSNLAQNHLCRPYRSEVQRYRAIFTWVSERIIWEEDFEGGIDTLQVIRTKRGCSKEIATLVMELCLAVGLHVTIVNGYLKVPNEATALEAALTPNHWWNAVVVDGEWRILDCALANPTHPRRGLFASSSSSAAQGTAEQWWFLTRPMQACFTHIPTAAEQQFICPSLPAEILIALPCTCPAFFKNEIELDGFDTGMLNLEGLELAHIQCFVPEDVECMAVVEVRAFERDGDNDLFESGEYLKKDALAQAEWVDGRKRYHIKALLPGDEGQGILKVYCGKRGLTQSNTSNPHPLAFVLPLRHKGINPPFKFVVRHPTPHALRSDLYIIQPQCYYLAVNNTYVFSIKQHPSSSSVSPALVSTVSYTSDRAASPAAPFAGTRPTSAMSMASVSAAGSAFSTTSSSAAATDAGSNSGNGINPSDKPAKLAIQSPSGKVTRLTRKREQAATRYTDETPTDGTSWETVIKPGEKGTWRALVLADRSARWCIFGEWECA